MHHPTHQTYKEFRVEHRDLCSCYLLCAHVRPIHSVQARVKQLADANKGKMAPEDYITTLPASPTELLASHPHVAKKLFDSNNLPVQSHPIPTDIAYFVRGRIKLRPQRQPAQGDLQLQAPSGRPISGNADDGRTAQAHTHMHACLPNYTENTVKKPDEIRVLFIDSKLALSTARIFCGPIYTPHVYATRQE